VRRHEVVAQLHRPHPLDHLVDQRGVAQRLAHLLAAEGHPAVVHPVLSEPVADRARLRLLVLVVREAQVQPSAVDVELGPEVALGHRRALQVPAGAAAAPRRRPRRGPRLALLVRLPQREVARVALARGVDDVVGRLEVPQLLPGQRAVLGEGTDVEVDVAVDGVGVATVDQPLHELHHVRHVAGRARLVRGRPDAEDVVGPGAGALVLVRPRPPRHAVLGSLGEDLVVDVGDVAHQRHAEAVAPLQPPAQHVEDERGTDVPDVRRPLDGEPADVHGGLSRTQGREVAHGAGGRVVQAEAHCAESTDAAQQV
jgi:hypothetical protein